jgi:hypothetical protein
MDDIIKSYREQAISIYVRMITIKIRFFYLCSEYPNAAFLPFAPCTVSSQSLSKYHSKTSTFTIIMANITTHSSTVVEFFSVNILIDMVVSMPERWYVWMVAATIGFH